LSNPFQNHVFELVCIFVGFRTIVMGKSKGSSSGEMSFLGHLEVLRWHLIRAAIAVAVFMVAAFLNRDFIFNEIILKPKNPDFFTNRMFAEFGQWLNSSFGIDASNLIINSQPLNLVNIDMAGQFMSHMEISLIAGLILASPFIIWELWRFIEPALMPNERKYTGGAVIFISGLFISGVLFGYFLIAPLSIHFLSSYIVSDQVLNTIKLSSYINTITSVTFASGLIFELPILVFFLSKVGIITPSFMRKYRKHAYVVLLIVAAIITPPDVFSQTLVCIPLIVLYEVSILISRSVLRKKESEMVSAERNKSL
jgi:sec-independent protein translocase protein TatC